MITQAPSRAPSICGSAGRILDLRYPAETTPRGFQEFRGPSAEQKLKEVWVPQVAFTNLKDSPSNQTASLRIFPDGWVEVMERTTGQFTIPINAGSFPFDKQTLDVEITVRRETTGEASLVVLQEDIDFSRPAQDLSIDGWTPGLVNIKRYTQPGWYGEFHSGLVVGLTVARNPVNVVATVFIPLLASLLIPLLAIWMNSTEEGEFKIDAFELGNIIVGGLFAVIALNFTINAAYSSVATGDNTVTRSVWFELCDPGGGPGHRGPALSVQCSDAALWAICSRADVQLPVMGCPIVGRWHRARVHFSGGVMKSADYADFTEWLKRKSA